MQEKSPADLRSPTPLYEPCPLVRRFSSKMAAAASNRPILDVACGSGRNALHLWQLGCTVICIDNDLQRLTAQNPSLSPGIPTTARQRLILKQIDLLKDPWPFGSSTAGGIVSVHFLTSTLLPLFESSLSPGGYLLLETVPGHGGNYLQLPRSGELRTVLARGFDIEFYRERKVGPPGHGAVSVRLLAKRQG